MANPATRPPAGTTNDEALDILRRIEPELSAMVAEQQRQAELLAKLDDRQRQQGETMAELKGRVSQLPTLYQIAALVFAVFGAAFVLIRYASGH